MINIRNKRLHNYGFILALVFIWMFLVPIGVYFPVLFVIASFGIIILIYRNYSQELALVLLIPSVFLSLFFLYGGFEEVYCNQKGREAARASGYKEMVPATEEDRIWLEKDRGPLSNLKLGEARVSPFWSGLRRCEESFTLTKIFTRSK